MVFFCDPVRSTGFSKQTIKKSMSEILVKVTRGNQIESIHRGHIVVANAEGEILYHLGDPDFKICMRSCAKPIQALPVITTGAADKFSLTPAELAAMSGSLNGQDFQVNAIKLKSDWMNDPCSVEFTALHTDQQLKNYRKKAKNPPPCTITAQVNTPLCSLSASIMDGRLITTPVKNIPYSSLY